MSRIRPKPGRRVRFNCWTVGNMTYEGSFPGKIPPISERTGVVVERRFGRYLVRRDADGVIQELWPSQLLEYVDQAQAQDAFPTLATKERVTP